MSAPFPTPDPLSGRLSVGFKTTPVDVDWATLDAIWQEAGQLEVFTAGWMADHLSNAGLERGGQSWEAPTLLAALAHHVPGKWLGHAVLGNTFRHPAVVAKAATVMDHVTGGRFILGIGAGWHEGEHEAFGIDLPPIGERIDRLESAVGVLRALFSEAARHEPGVTLADRFYPLRGAVNDPPPVGPDGPPIWLGGQKRRGMALAARAGSGWLMPGNRAG
ncbi:MAG TPA: LLM class flavin-dependent oxidoreductase, partial [Candidatus Binatus sp.]|nr:LLM class flavin-dependent oxidoreductase [Candidatus Binatus sp.]